MTRTRPLLHARGTAPLLPPTLDLLWQGRRLQPAGLNPAAPLTGTKSHFKKMSQSRSRIASEPFPIIMMFPSEHQRSYGRAGREPAAPVHGQGWGKLSLQPSLGHVTARPQLHIPVLSLLSPKSITCPLCSDKGWSVGTLPVLGVQVWGPAAQGC